MNSQKLYSCNSEFISHKLTTLTEIKVRIVRNFKAETLFLTRSNLHCLVFRCVVSFLFAPQCIFYCVRTWCVEWERHGLSDIATVLKEGGFFRRVRILILQLTIYATSQKILCSKIFYVFFKELSSAHQACIYLIQSTAKTVTFF